MGRSDVWQRVLAKALRVAPTDTTVFLLGESGTGKEVVARFIHQASPRTDGPFVAINCAALPEQLLESELFGYERGAFTGAQQAKAGQIELAARGVLFLDEVSEMSLSAQAKFLRFVQEREFQRLGGTRTQKANVRVIAACNRDLRQAVEQGKFREDLFYRLQVFDIALPPLRQRITDVPWLAEQFLGQALQGGWREKVLVCTKACRLGEAEFDFTPEGTRRCFEASLQRLGTDHVDILLAHDIEFADDFEFVFQETAGANCALVVK